MPGTSPSPTTLGRSWLGRPTLCRPSLCSTMPGFTYFSLFLYLLHTMQSTARKLAKTIFLKFKGVFLVLRKIAVARFLVVTCIGWMHLLAVTQKGKGKLTCVWWGREKAQASWVWWGMEKMASWPTVFCMLVGIGLPRPSPPPEDT